MGSKHLIRADIKAQILKRLKEEGVPVAKLAEEHGINPRTCQDPQTSDTFVKAK